VGCQLFVFNPIAFRRSKKNGSGAWTRTKILGSKGPCATNCTTPEWVQGYKIVADTGEIC
jgi:hypothetical protein